MSEKGKHEWTLEPVENNQVIVKCEKCAVTIRLRNSGDVKANADAIAGECK